MTSTTFASSRSRLDSDRAAWYPAKPPPATTTRGLPPSVLLSVALVVPPLFAVTMVVAYPVRPGGNA